MRKILWLLAIAGIVSFVCIESARADHDLTCHEPDPPPSGGGGGSKGGNVEFEWKVEEGESMELVLGLTAGGVSSHSCAAAPQNPGLVPMFLPLGSPSLVRLLSDDGSPALLWYFGPLDDGFADSLAGLTAELPTFTKPDGTPLLAQYNASDLAFLLQSGRSFSIGETLSVAAGALGGLPAVQIFELPTSFTLEQLFDRPQGFLTLYTGAAMVASIADARAIPEPNSLALLVCGSLLTHRRKRRVRFW